jgi:hypothetical protein
MNDYLSKPVALEELSAMLYTWAVSQSWNFLQLGFVLQGRSYADFPLKSV